MNPLTRFVDDLTVSAREVPSSRGGMGVTVFHHNRSSNPVIDEPRSSDRGFSTPRTK